LHEVQRIDTQPPGRTFKVSPDLGLGVTIGIKLSVAPYLGCDKNFRAVFVAVLAD
jgi:hypothetical protein